MLCEGDNEMELLVKRIERVTKIYSEEIISTQQGLKKIYLSEN